MSDSYDELLVDLAAEAESLDAHLTGLAAHQWDVATPAVGWSVKDCISHLAHIDGLAVSALLSPDDFQEAIRGIGVPGFPSGPDFTHAGVTTRRGLSGLDVLNEWRESRNVVLDALRVTDPHARVPWFARPMGVRSFATARLMETWAHGLDTYDAVHVQPIDTDRLRHVALLGCLTREFAFVVHQEAPADVAVSLVLPSGVLFEHGSTRAVSRVLGSAGDFCRVVTRRRHVDDTRLELVGVDARRWMLLAQAYAGQPGPGRQPGQFSDMSAGGR